MSEAPWHGSAPTLQPGRLRRWAKAPLAVTPLLLASGAGVAVPTLETPARCSEGPELQRPRLLRGVRVFIDNGTVPHPARSGFGFPRFDARLHHGDEVHFQTPFHNWLALTDDPYFALRGKSFNLQEVGSGRFCGFAHGRGAGAISCSEKSSLGETTFEMVHVGLNVAIRAGPNLFCTDRREGVACGKEISEHEALFSIVDAGGGLARLRGHRSGRYCADAGRGLVCDCPDGSQASVFRLLTGTTLKAVPVLTHDRHRAATFIVHRESLDSNMLALLCKGTGLYLAQEHTGRLSCSSSSPWFMASSRIAFRTRRHGLPKWDLRSVTFRAAGSGNFLAPSGQWTLEGTRSVLLDAADEFQWQAFLVGGCEIYRPLVRGVNLGGWFLIEKWMLKNLFIDKDGRPLADSCESKDEYGLMSQLGSKLGRRRMEEHWSSWITEEDIAWMADHGINAVRVPLGYWMVFPMHPFVPGQLKYLERLFQWCEKHSMSILLDFHGLKGSQTGNPTSGNCGACGNSTCGETWLNFLDEQKINLEVIRRLVVRFSDSPAYLGFAVANEVSSAVDREKLMLFYQRAYDIIREQSEDALVVLYGTFAPSLYPWDNFQRASVDVHIYFGWGFGRPTTDQQVNLVRASNAVSQVHWPVIVGEWSLAANGHPTLHWEPHRRDAFFNKFARMQLQAWETHSAGWFYWNYKTRFRNSTWNYRDMCEVGWLPGCTPDLKFAPGEWWKTPVCAYAYMDGQCGSAGQEGDAVADLASEAGIALPFMLSILALTIMVPTAAFVVVKRCRRTLSRSHWAPLPILSASQITRWEIDGTLLKKGSKDVDVNL